MKATIHPKELLYKIIRYAKGEGDYDFSKLPAQQRQNAAFDAWQEIEDEIQQYIEQE